MKIDFTAKFEKQYLRLPKQIKVKAEKQESVFRNNPFHSSLHTEKLSPKSREVWSFRIDNNYRVIFRFLEKDSVLFLNIGPHDWIYKIKF